MLGMEGNLGALAKTLPPYPINIYIYIYKQKAKLVCEWDIYKDIYSWSRTNEINMYVQLKGMTGVGHKT